MGHSLSGLWPDAVVRCYDDDCDVSDLHTKQRKALSTHDCIERTIICGALMVLAYMSVAFIACKALSVH
eukprot:scaffold55582_cov31-Tisochrysis_lutea.AAC.2